LVLAFQRQSTFPPYFKNWQTGIELSVWQKMSGLIRAGMQICMTGSARPKAGFLHSRVVYMDDEPRAGAAYRANKETVFYWRDGSMNDRSRTGKALLMPLWNGQEPLGGKAKEITAALDQLDRLEIFYIGTNGHVYQNFQTQPNGVLWAGEQKFSTDKAKQVILARDAAKNLNLFYIGTDNSLRQNIQTSAAKNTWSGDVNWGEPAKAGSVILDGTGALTFAFIDAHGQLFRKRQDNPATNHWSMTAPFGDVGVRSVALALDIGNRLFLIYVDQQENLVRRVQTDAINDIWSAPILFGSGKVREAYCLSDRTGALQVFYAGTNDQLFHDWQNDPNSDTWQGQTPFVGFKGSQIVSGESKAFGVECFFVGEKNGLWRNFEDTEPSQPNNANWHGFSRMAADLHKLASAKKITVANNADGRLEIFFVGTNDHIYHDWENSIPAGLASNVNQILADNCGVLKNVSVTINVNDDMVVDAKSGPHGGFSFQLNAYSQAGHRVVYQQYVFEFNDGTIGGAMENWKNLKDDVINTKFHICNISQKNLPSGFQLKVTLLNDDAGNVTGATFAVRDNAGNDIANVAKHLGLASKDLAPIIAFEINLVGPVNGQQVLFSSGSGTFTYDALGPLIPGGRLPPVKCTNVAQITAERSNVLYSVMPVHVVGPRRQRFEVTPGEPL
jgi:hypothetical protein